MLKNRSQNYRYRFLWNDKNAKMKQRRKSDENHDIEVSPNEKKSRE